MSDPDGMKKNIPSQGARSETLSFILWLNKLDQEMGRASANRDVNRCLMFRNVWRGKCFGPGEECVHSVMLAHT